MLKTYIGFQRQRLTFFLEALGKEVKALTAERADLRVQVPPLKAVHLSRHK